MTLLPNAASEYERHCAAPVAVLPIASFEEHGTYLSLIADTVVACVIAPAVLDRAAGGRA